ncbi:MAG: DNA replication and repair protein RecF [Muribaculaceae bacterium]|nr:DNA replication and repair protein RecF [Muribaculaceae bacterium]
MILRRIEIDNFKNIHRARLDFSPKVNGLLGNNGMGKSNLLDAIYYLSFTRSFTGVPDSMLTTRGEEFSLVKGAYDRRGIDEELSLGLATGRRKSLKRRGKEYRRISEHIGMFPLVMIAPSDIDLIRGTGEERRRWMDMVISQGDSRYLDQLIRYNHNLEQRNRMLRDGTSDRNLYLAVETAMDMAASYIHQARQRWIDRLTPIFDRHYTAIAGSGENTGLNYSSALNTPGSTLGDLLEESRRRDEAIRHTTTGIHRDDIEMTLGGMPVRRTGSQGQCKTFTIALRLAQYEFLREATGMKPMLLLDDIFDKLDASRVERIMEIAEHPDTGQIFITDTNRTHLDEIMKRTGGDYRLWEVSDGTFSPLNNPEDQ